MRESATGIRSLLAQPGWIQRAVRAFRMVLLFRHPVAAIRSRLRPSGSDWPILHQLRSGVSIKLAPAHADIVTINEVWIDKLYELDDDIVPREGWTIFDVGAHKGVFATRAAYLMGSGSIHCFEPDPANFALLRENTAQPCFDRVDVRLFEAAMFSATGEVTLFRGSSGSTGYSLLRQEGERSSVPSITLADSMDSIPQIDLLKLDVEGAELGILKAAPPGVMARIRRVALEYHPNEASLEIEGQIAALLKDHGFQVGVFPPRQMMWAVRSDESP